MASAVPIFVLYEVHDLAGNMTKMPRLVGNDANGHYMAVYDAST